VPCSRVHACRESHRPSSQEASPRRPTATTCTHPCRTRVLERVAQSNVCCHYAPPLAAATAHPALRVDKEHRLPTPTTWRPPPSAAFCLMLAIVAVSTPRQEPIAQNDSRSNPLFSVPCKEAWPLVHDPPASRDFFNGERRRPCFPPPFTVLSSTTPHWLVSFSCAGPKGAPRRGGARWTHCTTPHPPQQWSNPHHALVTSPATHR
jgi:hypothetical protein